MSTLLENSSRPLWVWVIVIVIGSLFVLGASTWLVWYCISKRRSRYDVEFLSDMTAEKKLTLRRGRLVPATSYLSLTGSKFGLNSYAADETMQSPSVRSKSPFEWWANLRSRSSRLSYVSHVSSAQYQSSIRTNSIYGRPELSNSKLSFTSKDGDVRATVTEIKVAKPQTVHHDTSSKRSSRSFEPVNFSRSFTPQTQRSLAAAHHHTLSRIEEITPRQSVSTTSFRARIGSYTSSENGHLAEQLASKLSSDPTLMNLPVAVSHSRNDSSNSVGEAIRQQHYIQTPTFTPISPTFPSSLPDVSSPLIIPTFPAPTINSNSTSTLYSRQSIWGSSSMKQFPQLNQRQHEHDSMISYDNYTSTSESQSQSQTHPLSQTNFTAMGYSTEQVQDRGRDQTPRQSMTTPQSRPPSGITLPVGPLRTRSRKGNVLRKKSLERGRVLSVYG